MNQLALDTHGLTQSPRTIGAIMGLVMLALVPGTIAYAWAIDSRVLVNIILAVVVAVCIEAILLALRGRSAKPAWTDGSIALAAWLLALCVPPSLPLWQLLIGVFIMSAIGKHLFGGLGHNPFNPAMVAYAVLIVSFPVTMTDWNYATSTQASQSTNTLSNSTSPDTSHAHTGYVSNRMQWDGLTGATPLDRLRYLQSTYRSSSQAIPSQTPAEQSVLSSTQAARLIMQSPWLWVNLGWFIGGMYLLFLKVISWHIPVAVLSTIAILYLLTGLFSTVPTLPVLPALLSGALMIGAFFIATDPVSAAAGKSGKLIYGSGIGILTFVIREYSVYPEGFAFAVLLMNICVPLIDHLTVSVHRQRRLPQETTATLSPEVIRRSEPESKTDSQVSRRS